MTRATSAVLIASRQRCKRQKPPFWGGFCNDLALWTTNSDENRDLAKCQFLNTITLVNIVAELHDAVF